MQLDSKNQNSIIATKTLRKTTVLSLVKFLNFIETDPTIPRPEKKSHMILNVISNIKSQNNQSKNLKKNKKLHYSNNVFKKKFIYE